MLNRSVAGGPLMISQGAQPLQNQYADAKEQTQCEHIGEQRSYSEHCS